MISSSKNQKHENYAENKNQWQNVVESANACQGCHGWLVTFKTNKILIVTF